eukprot:TRINITY_DN36708_c0_g4_i2.p3 TRINITY_DN36708_c0_g4~~TRINITY_DN36708_c0_g4_i2.p3  ORF type:complete len:163 (-),score=16.25 TRINITY_DN36708_c0_g4_i2:935-1423(-)
MLSRFIDILRNWLMDEWRITLKRNEGLDTTKIQQVNEVLKNTTIFMSLQFCSRYPPETVTIKSDGCIVTQFLSSQQKLVSTPDDVVFNSKLNWERRKEQLFVNEQALEAFRNFYVYFEDAVRLAQDETLEQELGILNLLIEKGDLNLKESLATLDMLKVDKP